MSFLSLVTPSTPLASLFNDPSEIGNIYMIFTNSDFPRHRKTSMSRKIGVVKLFRKTGENLNIRRRHMNN